MHIKQKLIKLIISAVSALLTAAILSGCSDVYNIRNPKTEVHTDSSKAPESRTLTTETTVITTVTTAADTGTPATTAEKKPDPETEKAEQTAAYSNPVIMYLIQDGALYNEAYLMSAVTGMLDAGDAVVVTGESGHWYSVNQSSATAYLRKDNVSPERPAFYAELEEKNGGIYYKGKRETITIDPGYQDKAIYDTEPNGPGSDIMKAMVSSGTKGYTTGIKEYIFNLEVGLKLRNELISRGYTVVMTRESHDVRISNVQRATIANNYNSAAFLRIHANSASDYSIHGAFALCVSSKNPYNPAMADSASLLSESVINSYCKATGVFNRGFKSNDSMTGLNWASVPAAILELGFMTNEEEDLYLATPEYKLKAAIGIADGIDGFIAERKSALQKQVNKIAEKYGVQGLSVALINNGTSDETFEYGWAVKNVTPVTADTKFRSASLSKVVIAMLALSMADEGKLDVMAPLSDYIGTVPVNPYYPEDTIRLIDMFTHTSSFATRSYTDTYAEMINRLSTAKAYTEFRPGTIEAFHYNNYIYGFLGTLLDKINGKTMSAYLRDGLFNKLGINASFAPADIGRELTAELYTDDGSVGISLDELMQITDLTALGANSQCYAGGLTISARDYAKLMSVLLNDGMYNGERILSEAAVAMLEKQYYPAGTMDFAQCMTLRYKDGMYGRDGLYYHTGNNFGLYSFMSYDPITKSGIVVMTSGAKKSYDKESIYAVCGELADFFYNYYLD